MKFSEKSQKTISKKTKNMENNTEILNQKIQFLRKFLEKDSIKENETEFLKQFFENFSFITSLTYKTKVYVF